ncbi:MAG: hypothetical protein RBS39_00570 [Phycisphaerales bacterium]|nr:hypothetical protein [Phycisphaerales bacterium]
MASRGDIIKLLQPDDLLADDLLRIDGDDSERDETTADDVIGLALNRKRMLGKAYPFEIADSSIRFLDANAQTFGSAYLFYLLFCSIKPDFITPEARHFFELESMDVVHSFFGGYAFHFGWTQLNAGRGKIHSRIQQFCDESNLGWRPRNPHLVSSSMNDIGIDVIVWNVSNDNRGNAFVVVAQCATGHNWDQKLVSSARTHLEDCLDASRDGPWINSFCTPFEIPDRIWRQSARSHDGYIFDRLRLVLESRGKGGAKCGCLASQGSKKWVKSMLRELANNRYGQAIG